MIDGADIADLEQRLERACKDLTARTEAVGISRSVREFASDRRKNLLATYKRKNADKCDSDAGQETLARADVEYQKEFDTLFAESQRSEIHIANWDAAYVRFEAARSLMSMAKAQVPAAMRGTQ